MNASDRAKPDELRFWAGVLLFAAAFGVIFHFPYLPLQMPRVATPIWPATSVALAGLLVCGRRAWPWLLGLTSATALLYQAYVVGVPWSVNIGLVVINSAQALATAWLIQRWTGGSFTLARLRDVGVLLGTVAAVNIVMAALAMQVAAEFLRVDPLAHLRTRFISHTLAGWIVTPAAFTLVAAGGKLRREPWTRWLEAAALALGSHFLLRFAVGATRFDTVLQPAPYLAVLPVVAAALRFGPLGATWTMLLVGLNIAGAVGQGSGWPPGEDYYARLSHAQLLLGVAAVTGLLLAASAAEKAAAAQGWREGEERFRLLFERAVDAICTVSRGRLALVNPACRRLFGLPPGRAAEEPALLDCVHPEDRAAVGDLCTRLETDATGPDRIEVRGVRTDGAAFPLQVQATQFALAGERHLLLRLRDLTEEQHAAREIRRINRVLHAISGINRVLVRATMESDLLFEVCRIASTSEGYRMAWVGYVEHDEHKRVRPVAWSGIEDGYVAEVKITWADTELGRGPAGRAIRSGQPVSCRNIATDPDYGPWREEARKRGYQSSIAVPLKERGQVFAVLSLYSAEADAFDSPEVVLLQEMADSLAFGLKALRARENQERAEQEVRRLLAEAEAGRKALLSTLEERKRAEEARDRSEERYQSAVRDSAIGMALVASDGRWIEVNPALCALLGYTREELIGASSIELTHPDDRALGALRREDLLAGRIAPYSREKRYRHRNGQAIWVQLSASLAGAVADGSRHIFVQIQDITARKLAEENLAGTAERLAVALRASKFGVWRYNVQTAAYEWDNRMFAIWGFPVSGTVPPVEDVLARVADEDRPALRASLQASSNCDHDYHQRIRICWPDGQVRHVEMHGFIHDDSIGRPEWAIGVAGDVTEIVRATGESERLRAQLQQARKMEALGNMAAGVAHDFNNLLTGINGFVELASTSLPPTHEASQLLEQAHKGAISARDLVRRILNFSRGTKENSRAVVDLVGVVRETTPLIIAAMPTNVSLSLAAKCDAAPVLADAGQLQQVMMNLCTNAAHAIGTRPGRIQVAIDLCDVGSPPQADVPPGCTSGRHVRLAVSDTGCGMSEDTRRRLFEPYFTTKSAGEGTGLGLPIVHDIVTAHEGCIQIQSTLGKGTTFQIYLPLAGRETAARPPTAPSLPVRGGGQRVLVVDDEASVAMILRLALQKGGFEPEVFTSPTDAWAQFTSDPTRYEVLIVDQNMPDITGPEFISRARARVPSLPVIIISGRFEATSGPDWLGAEKVTALKKPFEIVDLLGAVRASLAGSKSESL